MAMHPDVDLSAYLDDALTPDERARLEVHLAGCAECREDLEELRGVRRLLARLPERAPRRSLLPRRSLPSWLVPARWVSTVAAAAFALVFAVSSVQTLPLSERAAPAAAPAPAPAPAPQGAADQAAEKSAPTAAPAPAPSGQFFAPITASPGAFTTAASGAPQRATAQPRGTSAADRIQTVSGQPAAAPPSWLWLAAALVSGIIAFVLQRRIARARR